MNLGGTFTLEELKKAVGRRELPLEEMKKTAGGTVPALHDTYDQSDSEKECPLSPTGRHVWKEAGVFTEYLIVRHHVMICEYCGKGEDHMGIF